MRSDWISCRLSGNEFCSATRCPVGVRFKLVSLTTDYRRCCQKVAAFFVLVNRGFAFLYHYPILLTELVASDSHLTFSSPASFNIFPPVMEIKSTRTAGLWSRVQ